MYLFWAWPIAAFGFLLNFIVAIIPFYILSVFGMKKTALSWFYMNERFFSGFLFFLLGLKLDIRIHPAAEKLLDSGTPLCFYANHTSMLDIPAVVYATKAKTGFVAKDVIGKIPVLNLIAKAMKCVMIDRSDPRASAEGIRIGVKTIQSGHSMLIFPEGTRSKTGEIADFKHGSFRLSIESGVPSVPVTIRGLRQAIEDRKRFFGRYEAHIIVGEPVIISMEDDREERFEKIELFEKNIRETYASLGDR